MEEKIQYPLDDIEIALSEFYALYATRPIKDNGGGMKSPHLFNTWYAVKKLQPKLIIESGVWRGLGTWFLEKAAPDSTIISIEINYSNLIYKSPDVVYLNQDIKTYDWDKILNEKYAHISRDEILVFLDDHQNFLHRLEFIHSLGIKHILYEDNYPPSQGDAYSPKKILSCEDYVIDRAGAREMHKFSYQSRADFERFVKTYQELPPIFKLNQTRWGDVWEDPNYPTKPPLLSNERKKDFPVFFDEADSYTWICYMELT